MKSRKFISIIIVLVMCATFLCGCGKNDTTISAQFEASSTLVQTQENHTVNTFKEINYEYGIVWKTNQYIVYDPETLVMYTIFQFNGGGISITPMYNADGTLRLYDFN